MNLKIKEKKNYMNMIGLKETGLNLLIQKGYKILELETYFTSGLKKQEHGLFKKIVQHQKQLEKFILILKKVLSELKLYLIMILLIMMVG